MKSEWSGHLKHIENALMCDLYHPLGMIEFQGFVTEESYTLTKATQMKKTSFPTGCAWGKPWHYAWLFAQIRVPKEAKDERIIMNLNPGGEATIFVNGEAFGTRRADWIEKQHHYYVDQTLTRQAQGDEVYELACEVYGGHPLPRTSVGVWETGPVFPEEEKDIMQCKTAVVGENSYGIWNEEAYQLWLDIMVLREIMECGDQHSFRVEAIEYGLKKLIVSIDMEQSFTIRRKVYKEMRALLKPLMEAKNGSSAPQFETVGNAHIDVAWGWDMDVTRRKTARTFAAQLRLMEEYPEMRFVQSQPVLYEMCKEHYPDVFAKIKEKAKTGQWIADGAMWVEPDTNLSSGESLIRQFLYGKKYFKEEFDVDSKLCWLPDTFGYTAALPQILKGCGVEYLTTQKIYWTYNESEKFPHHAFAWQGMDGSKIDSYVHMKYESMVNPAVLLEHWKNRMERDGTGKFFLPYGYGDGGGGPTRDDQEQIRRTTNLEGAPKMNYTTPYQFMEELKETTDVFQRNIFNGELYFPCHRGTYTTQANVKRDNRKTEIAMHEAELWSAIGNWSYECNYESDLLEKSWKKVLLNQFHDILPGSSIAKVYEDADACYKEVYKNTEEIEGRIFKSMLDNSQGYTYFNGTSFERESYVTLPDNFREGARYVNGEAVPCVPTENGLLARVKVPAYGHVSLVESEKTEIEKQVFLTQLCGGGYRLENSCLVAVIEKDGTLSQVISKETNQSFLNGKGNYFQMFRDVPRKFDSWDIDVMVEECEIKLDASDAVLAPLVDNDLEVIVKLERTIGVSHVTQEISLRAGEKKLEFRTTVDWKELHKLLKVSFATGVKAEMAKNQIQFGFIERPTHRTYAHDADRFEVCNHFYTAINDTTHGAAIMNESKYGVSMLNDVLSLTLLKTGAHPDFRSDNHIHHFAYSYTFFDTPWAEAPIVKDAYCFNQKLLGFKGVTTDTSYFQIEKDNIVLETVKLTEDGSGDILLRFYESKQGTTRTAVTINLPFEQAFACDMLENIKEPLQVEGSVITLLFTPFEVKTIRIRK